MTTQETKKDLRLKIKSKTNKDILDIHYGNQSNLNAGSDLEDGLIINDIVKEEIERRLTGIYSSPNYNDMFNYFELNL